MRSISTVVAQTIRVAVLGSAIALAWTMGPSSGSAQAAPHNHAAAQSIERPVYGDPGAAAKFWRRQAYDDDCVPMSVADVVGQLTGHQPSEEAIIDLAHSTPSTVHSGPIYTKPVNNGKGAGTFFNDEPALLAYYGIHAVSTHRKDAAQTGIPTGIRALEQNLANGRKVIVGVNAQLLWHEPVKDITSGGDPRSNHAVVVTGVDTALGVVHVNDSGSASGRDELIPIDVFIRSWDSSDDQMTVNI